MRSKFDYPDSHMTLSNESVTFTSRGIWIQPIYSDGFWFMGSPTELLSIMVYHHELDIQFVAFRVRETF